jgi:hypothetical protein
MARTVSNTALAIAVAAAALAAPSPSRAADPTTADCLGANDKSISLRNDHKLGAARAQLLVCAASSCPADIRNECTRRVADVNAAMPTIVFEVKDGAGRDLSAVKVSMDGQPLAERLEGTALSIDPGVHTFAFEAAGQPKVEKQLVIREGQKGRREPVTIGAAGAKAVTPAQTTAAAPEKTTSQVSASTADLSPAQPAGGHGLGGQKMAALVAGGIGIVGVGLGTVFGLQAMSKYNDANGVCPDKCSDQTGVELWKSTRSAGNASTVAFIVGGVGLAAGAVLWFTSKPSKSTQVGVGPGSIELKGSW